MFNWNKAEEEIVYTEEMLDETKTTEWNVCWEVVDILECEIPKVSEEYKWFLFRRK